MDGGRGERSRRGNRIKALAVGCLSGKVMVAIERAQEIFVFLHESLCGVKKLFKMHGNHLEVVEGGIFYVFHFEMAAYAKTFHYRLKFVGAVKRIMKGFQLNRRCRRRELTV